MSAKQKWDDQVTLTAKEYFQTPPFIPHKGFVMLVRELEKEIGKEKTHRIVAKVRDDVALDFAERLRKERDYDSFEEFSQDMFQAIRAEFKTSTAAGQPEDSPGYEMVTNYTACVLHEIYDEWDALDIGYLWNCMADYGMVNAFSKKASFDRPEVLMLGDKECKFCWKWDEKE